jgi:hypothetical protein
MSSSFRFAFDAWIGFIIMAFIAIVLATFVLFFWGGEQYNLPSGQKYAYEALVFGGIIWCISLVLSLPSVLILGTGFSFVNWDILQNKPARVLHFVGINACNNALYYGILLLMLYSDRTFTTERCVGAGIFALITFILGSVSIIWLNRKAADDYFVK